MKLIDIKNGNIKVSGQTTITHKGKIYRGKAQISELIAIELPDPIKVTKKTARVYKSKSEQRRVESQIVVEPTDEQIKEVSEVEGADRDESGDEEN